MARWKERSAKIRRIVRKTLFLGALEDLTIDQRREMWPPAMELQSKHIRNCSLIENRIKMLDYMPKRGVCAELGILDGDFSASILEVLQPSKLYLVDIDRSSIENAKKRFAREISEGVVSVHLGDSAEIINAMPPEHFDWVYIDADHSYQGAKRDIEAVRTKLKPEGIIVLNDYIFFSPSDFTKYGVVEAANEFCINHDFELIYFAMQGRMYSDIAIRAIQ